MAVSILTCIQGFSVKFFSADIPIMQISHILIKDHIKIISLKQLNQIWLGCSPLKFCLTAPPSFQAFKMTTIT